MSVSEKLLKKISDTVTDGLCSGEFAELEENLDALLRDLPQGDRIKALEKAWFTEITVSGHVIEPRRIISPMGSGADEIRDEVLNLMGAYEDGRAAADWDAIARRVSALDLSGAWIESPNGRVIRISRISCADELEKNGIRAWFGQRLPDAPGEWIEPEDISEIAADAANSGDYEALVRRLDDLPEQEARKLLRRAWITCATISWDGSEPDSALALPMDADRTEVRTELFKMLRDASEGAGADWEAAREGIWSLDLSEDRMEGPDGRTLEVWRMSCADVLKEQGIERPYLGDAQAPGPRM